ncbi:MAG: glycosyltransferase family 4 protein [Acidaminococcus sp.]|jgi:glycosyltransferase involved in cell wall biosynthesis|nr:glycosyltransferase family 4 protein [Acidaminococcus sp.]MCI2116452.1 glycosyltransferase family 4 protein [Acidaminococcus sp.]
MKVSSILKGIDKYKVESFIKFCKNEPPSKILEKIKNYVKTYDASPDDVNLDLSRPSTLQNYKQLVFNKFSKPTVTIYVIAGNNFAETYFSLEKILANTNDVEYEVKVFTKDKEQIEKLTKLAHGISVINTKEKQDLHSKSEYACVLKAPDSVQKNWLSNLVKVFDANNDIGLAGAKILSYDGKILDAGSIRWENGQYERMGFGFPLTSVENSYVKTVSALSYPFFIATYEFFEKMSHPFPKDADEMHDVCELAQSYKLKIIYQPFSMIVSGLKDYGYKSICRDNCERQEKDSKFFARDCSFGKKIILVIDRYVPRFDQDAGSRTTYHYLKLFVKMGLHVIFVGDDYFLHEPYTTNLEQMGIEVLGGDSWNREKFFEWLKEHGQFVDYACLNRPNVSIKYMDLFKKLTRAKIIYYGHDLHFIRESRQYEIEKNPDLLKSIERWKKIEGYLFENADVIYTPGSYEEDILKSMYPQKRISAIPIYLYDNKILNSTIIPKFDERDGLLFVGGFGHKPNEDAILWFMNSVFPLILKEIPNIKLYIVGSHPTADIKSFASNKVIVTGFIDDMELKKLYMRCRVVVVPLRYGAGIKGKVVEAIRWGVPTVTTTIGAEGLKKVEQCIEVTEVGDATDYAGRVVQLLQDPQYWQQQSEKELQYTKENFTIEAASNILKNDIDF